MLEHLQTSSADSDLETPLQFIKGVGPVLYERLKKKGLYTSRDMLFFLPRKYHSRKVIPDIQNLIPGEYACVEGEIFDKKIQRRQKWNSSFFYQITLRTFKNNFIGIKYFKQPYRNFLDSFEIGQEVKVCGVVHEFKGQPEFHHPDFMPRQSEEGLWPVYSDIEGVSQKKIRNIIKNIFENSTQKTLSDLPEALRKEFNVLDLWTSLKDIHSPAMSDMESYLKFQAHSQQSFIFLELFKLQLYLGLRKLKLAKNKTHAIQSEGQQTRQFNQNLPFQWTKAQKRVFDEIVQDINQTVSMRRLIQGDVGCGKTSVALQACCYAIESGFQTAFMAPTEILAEQHFEKARQSFSSLGFQVDLLTSKVKNKQKVLERIESGECHLCIGTQALIQDHVRFKKLGLVVIDEQHRFGVVQRDRLSDNKHCLVMTATPIPRTLAMALYSDLDISVIDEMPPGRRDVITRKTRKRKEVFLFLEREVLKGRQAYVVYPLIEESEKIDLKNAKLQFEKFKKSFPHIRWGLLHGKMTAFEKSQVMQEFVQNQIQVLVSTTVIEVGVDVPNAALMVVEHSERFGLAQLHQMRGRVGRGGHKSYCFLVIGDKASREAVERASILEKSSDGFFIAEKDLKCRGAGELMGTKQSGLTLFQLADLYRDQDVLKKTKRAVQWIIDRDPYLQKSPALKKEMESLYSQ